MEIVDIDSITRGTEEKEGIEALQPPISSITDDDLNFILKIFSKWNCVDCCQEIKQLIQ